MFCNDGYVANWILVDELMTVYELIKKLKSIPGDTKVVVYCDSPYVKISGWVDITDVDLFAVNCDKDDPTFYIDTGNGSINCVSIG